MQPQIIPPGGTLTLPPVPIPPGFDVYSVDAGEREDLGGGLYRQIFTVTLMNADLQELDISIVVEYRAASLTWWRRMVRRFRRQPAETPRVDVDQFRSVPLQTSANDDGSLGNPA